MVSKSEISSQPMFLKLDQPVERYFESGYEKLDRNGDGVLQKEEVKQHLKKEGFSEGASELVFSCADRDRNGAIDFGEFVRMLLRFRAAFRDYAERYVSLFIIAKPQEGAAIVTWRRKIFPEDSYENLTCFNTSTLTLVILSLLQVVVHIFFSNWDVWMDFKYDKKHELWRYVTFIFSHSNYAHLFLNVFTQLLLGFPLVMVHGWRVLVIYFAGALGGCLFQSACYPTQNLKGCSPAVYAIIAAHISKIALNFTEVTQATAQLIILLTFTILDTVYNYIAGGNDGQVSYISHLGGALTGFLAGSFILKNVKVLAFERIITFVCLGLYVVMMVVLISLDLCH